ncbi:MAG: hypothetical protein JWO56_3470, partial [Acidobacteria bacterium]|nr:hypothetical protein [Acidobacteriota bacterium]
NIVMPEWSRTKGDELYATVMERGFIDLHRFAADGSEVAVTRTQGGAFSAAPSSDGRLFFMSLEPDGFVIRTVGGDVPPAPPAGAGDLPVDRDLTPALALAPERTSSFASGTVSTPRPYGIGRQEPGWLTGGTYAAGVRTTELGIRLGDVVGRLDTLAIVALGRGRSPHGFALASAWRGGPVTVGAHAYSARGVDAPEHGLELRGSWNAIFPRSSVTVAAGALGGSIARAFAESAFRTRQLRGPARADESLALAVDAGGGARHIRGLVRGTLTLGGLRIGGRYQRDSASGERALSNDGLEQLALGGVATSIVPLSAFATRILDPALEPRTLAGTRYEGRRAELGYGPLTAFWQGHSVDGRRVSLAGIEYVTHIAAMPIVKAPALDLTAGVARLLDGHRTRAWLSVRWRP